MPAPHHSIVYMPDALPDAQPTVLKPSHCRVDTRKNSLPATVERFSNLGCFKSFVSKVSKYLLQAYQGFYT